MEKPYIQIRDGLDAVINRAVFMKWQTIVLFIMADWYLVIWLFHPLSSQAVDEDQMPDTLHADRPAS